MKVILLERVERLGALGDVVTVKDGFARNFLLPRTKALRANSANMKVFEDMRADIEDLKAKSASLAAEIDSYQHRNSLFDPTSLDPDILSEKGLALLQMAPPEDLLVMTDPKTGLPISGSAAELTQDQSSPTIARGID